MEDFIFKGCPGSNNGEGPVSAEAETLLLLESVFKHGNKWDLVAQTNEGGDSSSLCLPVNDGLKPSELYGSDEPPSKRQCIAPAILSGDSSLLKKQVARISTMVGPEVASAAAEAAVTVLCDESSCPREIFYVDDHILTIGTQLYELERELDQNDVEMKERLHQSGHDSETWGLAAPDAFEAVPQICRYILSI
ncbi:hypothetical protein ACFE04_026874 [Oxalis oulophora]